VLFDCDFSSRDEPAGWQSDAQSAVTRVI